MKKFWMPFLLFCVTAAQAQLNNSWIDYSKTYYKFKVAKSGIYRINQPALSAAGLAAIPAEQLQLWRNGAQVRLFTSATTGLLGANDYVEFWGERNDGKADKNLYRDTTTQLSDSFSLHSDTATYFLTFNNGNNLRYTKTLNNVASNTLPAEAYFMRKVTAAYKSQYNGGYAAVVGQYVYSSAYDLGEGNTSGNISPSGDLYQSFDNLNVYTGAPANSLSFYLSAFGNAQNVRNIRVKFNDKVLFDNVPMNYFSMLKKQVDNIPLSILPNTSNIQVAVNGTSTNVNDRVVVGEMTLTYPAQFNFNNEKNFYFELPASALGNYLEIDNFNAGAVAPVLYGLNDGIRIEADRTVAGKLRYVLPASAIALRKFQVVNEEAANISVVNGLTAKTFINYALPANQGDYLIISHPALYNDGKGNDYVDQYKQYRASVAGGSYTAKVIPIEELNDQFAFGIKMHPAAIRDFIRFAVQQFSVVPKYVFIIGRGINTQEYKQYENDAVTAKTNFVQTFGWPASDILLACAPGQMVPLVAIGRLSVINGTEIKYYLDKVKQYDQAQASPSQTVADKAWMKNVINVAGGSDNSETDLFVSYLDGYKKTISDSAFGGNVETFVKASSSAVVQADGERIQQLINGGVSLIQYFGHSSANTLGFNLSSPEVYTNYGKYPFFSVSGCSAGNFYVYDPARLDGNLTLSEKYVLAEQKGCIGFLASTHFGIPPFLNNYNTQLYNNMALWQYGNTVGNQIKGVLKALGSNAASIDYYTRLHLEEMNLQGDPAIRLNSFTKPDFVIEDQLLKISPSIISVADVNFSLKVQMVNIGKVVKDSIRVTVIRKLPNDSSVILFNQLVPAIKNTDSLSFSVPIRPATEKGLNKIIVTLDADNKVNELSETNNSITKEFYILEDEIRPVYPYNYSIVNKQDVKFTVSTANPLVGQRQYQMELDTTALFNSPFKKQYAASGVGGVVEFVPTNIQLKDSNVYYWRTSIVPINNAQQTWNIASFVYLANSSEGFNQSHYYQYQESTYGNSIYLGSDRALHFKTVPRNLVIKTGLYPTILYDRINVKIDFEQLEQYGCKYGSLQFLVYDSLNLKPWTNYNTAGSGRFGSWPVCNVRPDGTRYFFEFPYGDPVYRKRAMDFIDSIPNGMVVSITNLGWTPNTSFISDWQKDTVLLGSGKSLYHKLKSIGFSTIDNFTKNLPFVYVFQKNTISTILNQKIGQNENEQLEETIPLQFKFETGTIESPSFGPAKKWTSLQWKGKSLDQGPGDTVQIQVYGIKTDGSQFLLATLNPAKDTSLAFIDAEQYPFIKLKMTNTDETFATPNQLNFWRINADYVAEGAVAPNLLFTMKDSVEQGEKINFALAFKNISATAFDSLQLKLVITDRNNVPHVITLPKGKALAAGDTLSLKCTIDSKAYPGSNTLYVMVNPDNDQKEQYLYNNFLYKNFYVKEDQFNPLLDVTFDGVHILNRDIVAAKPHVLIKLKDESRYLALVDTALLKLQVRFPDGSLHNYAFGDSVRFNAATLVNGDNTASIDFMPHFAEDGDYQLIVSGRDVMGNAAGKLEYRVTFSVINKAMISNMLNYPNPFTSSTAFVFTVTGSEPPQNMRIQILTITGKIVREITKAELGDIHIGRNITDFKWNGTDAYGQQLANGVYLYRVITNLNGKSLEKYTQQGEKTDQYFNKGYGKMYLMR